MVDGDQIHIAAGDVVAGPGASELFTPVAGIGASPPARQVDGI